MIFYMDKLLTRVMEVALPPLLLFVGALFLIDHTLPWLLQSGHHPTPFFQLSLSLLTGIFGASSFYASYVQFIHHDDTQENWKATDDGHFSIIWRLFTFFLLVALSGTWIILGLIYCAKDLGVWWIIIQGMVFLNLLLHCFCAIRIIMQYHNRFKDVLSNSIPDNNDKADFAENTIKSGLYLYGRLPQIALKITVGFLLLSFFPFPPLSYFKYVNTNLWSSFLYWYICIIGTFSIIVSFIRLFKKQPERINWFSKRKRKKLWHYIIVAQTILFIIGLVFLIPGIAEIPQSQMKYKGVIIWKPDIVTGYIILAVSFLSNIFINFQCTILQRVFEPFGRHENKRTA